MKRAPMISGGRLPPAFYRNVNLRDAWSHSAQCDGFFEKLSDLPGGQPHIGCACWCHKTEFDSDSEPEYDPGHEL